MKSFIRMAALAVAAVLTIGADKPPHPNWAAFVTVTESGSHVLGDPDAPLKLTEFISYTCPHCAHFQEQSEAALNLVYVQPGKVSVEVRHLMRDPVDTAVALLTNCGDPSRFFMNHSFFLHRQDRWIQVLGTASKTQQQRWYIGDLGKRMRAVASDFGFYALMEQRGYDRATVNRCLADKEMAEKLGAQTRHAEEAGITATPSFMLDGVPLAGTHDWQMLNIQLQARM